MESRVIRRGMETYTLAFAQVKAVDKPRLVTQMLRRGSWTLWEI